MATKAKRSPAQRAATAKLIALNAKRRRGKGSAKRKNPAERRSASTPTRRGLGHAVMGDSLLAVFALSSDARAFGQAVADQLGKPLRVVSGAYTFTPDAR
jgi:hypothetical protein